MTELHSQDYAAVAPKTDDRAATNSPRVSPNYKLEDASTKEFRFRVCSDSNTPSTVERFAPGNDSDKFPGSDSKSLLSEFDEYVAAERHVARDLGFGLEVGDMVWGKVKSHPWWPGHIYNEAFASPSVRRSKREGHFLVAFFGDSSYGWFEPAELIPFDANFAEKSQQTNSRTFLRAVEEAVDEACRRRGLGLACKCRNGANFRPTNVEGYFCVDVEDHEPGGLYSDLQIRKARNGFKPSEALAFVKQLAVAPHDSGHGSIEFSNNKATLSAYRKAVFEQFDETYAQAFGVQPMRPTHPQSKPLGQPGNVRHPTRAPLSGPLVTSEAWGGGKSTTKSVKVKESLKKDKYLLKRRDDPNNSVQLAYNEEKSDAAARYVFQKRAPAVPVVSHNLEKQADTGFISHDSAASISDAKETLIDAKPHLDRVKGSSEVTHSFDRNDASNDGNSKLSGPCEDLKQIEQGPLTIVDGVNDMHPVKSENNVYDSPVEAKHHKVSALKKMKSHKRPADVLNSKTSVVREGKKKKRKDLNLQPTLGSVEKHSAFVKSIGKVVSSALAPREDFPAEQVDVDANAHNLLQMDTVGNANFELPQLLVDLQALALNPFHGIERKIPAAVQQFFLRFRVSDNPDDYIRASPVVKPVKHIVRPDGPTKAGRKRAPSDRQEEISAKRLKKPKDLKALASEKAVTSQKTSEARREDGKESIPQAPSKLVKLDSTKKVDCATKTVEPTMLMIKFPPETSLPSIAELKARFVRFGPMDQSGFRVFWNSSTCRVVFLHKADAQAAYKHSLANQTLFGSVGVRCSLREFGDSAPEVSEVAKGRADDGATEMPRVKDPAVVHRTSVSLHQPLSQPIQLKSCLKKSTGDESGQVTGNGSSSKGNTRVKFLLGGEESSRGDQLMVSSRNNFNNDSFADAGAPPIATEFNTTATTVDISHQMIHLLTRCSDVVTNLTGLLGYVPYHPL
uniref:Oxidoreductase GLYR1 n=1 Tax=Cajanus cajan TaxID=3821 RepID=A0A151TW17_CAJCA|nr:Putative oxidoreductase GLYR1 [Cajanus cajan]